MIEMYLAGVSTRGDRGRIRDSLGVDRLRRDRLQPQREGVRLGRGVAEPPARARLPLRPRRRDIPEAQPGRGLRERRRHGGHRRQRRRLPRGHRRRRGLHGVVGVLAGVPVPAAVPRPSRRAGDRRGQGVRNGRLDREVFPEAAHRRCTVHFYRNVMARVPKCEWGLRHYLDVMLVDGWPYRMAVLWGCRKVCKNLDGTGTVLMSIPFVRASKYSKVYNGQNVRSRTGAGMAECIAVLGSDYQYNPQLEDDYTQVSDNEALPREETRAFCTYTGSADRERRTCSRSSTASSSRPILPPPRWPAITSWSITRAHQRRF